MCPLVPTDCAWGLTISYVAVPLQHYDFFNETDNVNVANGGQRVATVLLYLTDVNDGR
jgi:hypothetical protein